jgi:putative transcriptional regulator
MTDTPYILIATSQITEGIFAESVIVMVEHNHDGALGFIVNKPTQVKLTEGVTLAGGRSPRSADASAWIGGPVDTDRAVVLFDRHALPWTQSLSTEELPITALSPLIALTPAVGRFLETMNATGLPDLAGQQLPFKFLLGYSGWGSAQLAGELQRGSWVVLPFDEGLVLSNTPETMWTQALMRQGINPLTVHQVDPQVMN